MTAPKPRRRRDPGRRPSAAALAAAANGDWTNQAACRSQPGYTSQDPDSIAYTCSRCSVAADCAQLGKLELARALTDTADRGEGRVYAGHQLADLLRLARHNNAGRQAAYRALDTTLRASAAWSVFGYNCTRCGQTPDSMTRTLPDGTTITYTSADRARRMDEARRSLKAAMVTISHAQTAALAVAATPYRVEAVNHAAEHAMAAIRGMDKALRADWMDPRGGTYDGNL